MAEDTRYRLDDFELYRYAREYRRKVYRLIKQLPACERYCLDRQMRKAAVSITNNVAEGHGRWHYQENMQYCRMELRGDGYDLIKRINGYIAYLRKSQQGRDS